MKKIYLFLLIFVFLVVSAFAGELIVGGGYFYPVGGGLSADYSMSTTGCSLASGGFSGETFTFSGTNRTYIDCAGVLQAASINTPRVESDGLLLEPVGANIVLQSRNFDTSPWAAVGTVNLSQNQTGVDGAANKAWIFDDDDSGSQEGIYYTLTVTSSTRSYTFSLFVKKTISASSFPGIGLVIQGVSTSVGQVIVNTDNGTLTDRTGNPPDDKGIESAGDFWRVWITQADNDSGNTTLRLWIFAAVNTDGSGDWLNPPEGSMVVDAIQLEYDTPYPSSYIDNDGVAEGAEQSSGNLTVGKSYRITATTVDYFYTGCAVNDYFIATAATALDASNKVTEFGTVRATEAGALTYDLPSDLFAETLGAEQVTNGTFDTDTDWTKGPGWTIAANKATSDGTAANLTSTGDGSEADKFYKVSFEVTDYTSGTVILSGYSTDGSPTLSGLGVWTGYLTATGAIGVRFYSNSFIGSIDNVFIKEVTNAYDSGDGLAPPHGTAIVWWKPGYNSVGSLSAGLLSTSFATANFIYHGTTNTIRLADGSSTASVSLTYTKYTAYKIVAKWGYLTSNEAKYRIGYDSGSGVAWGAELDYDGAFGVGSDLTLGLSLGYPYHNKRTQIYKQTLSDAEIDATPAP